MAVELWAVFGIAFVALALVGYALFLANKASNSTRDFSERLVRDVLDRSLSACDLALDAKRIEHETKQAVAGGPRPMPSVVPSAIKIDTSRFTDDHDISVNHAPDPIG